MILFKPHSSLLLLLQTLLFTIFFFSSSDGGILPEQLQAIAQHEVADARDFGRLIRGKKMPLLEGTLGGNSTENSTLALAAQRTYRTDPFNGNKKYAGGWNISDQHYWDSVAFTAAPLFIVAIVWFLAFGMTLSLICFCYCCCRRERYGYSRAAYALSLILLILFTVAAIIGCIVLYSGQGKFHRSTSNTLDYIMKEVDFTVDNLKNVSDVLSAAKQVGLNNIFLPSDVQTKIDQIESKINASSVNLADRANSNSRKIRNVLDETRVTLIVIAAIMLLLAFLGFLLSIFGMQALVYILVIIGWLLVAGTFILCGTFLILHNVVGDTCVAMDEWVEQPSAHTALDDILPCVDVATANETLFQAKDVSYLLADLVNQVITNVSNLNFSPYFKPFYYNQSGPLVPLLCNPFNPDMTDRICTTGEVDLSNATQVWQNYVCQSSAGICTTVGRLTPSLYNEMLSAVTISNGLYRYGPFLVDLEDCTFVREAFSAITDQHCPGLRQYSRQTYTGLLMVSTAVMLSLIFWVIYARERRHRVYTKQFVAGSNQSPSAQGKSTS